MRKESDELVWEANLLSELAFYRYSRPCNTFAFDALSASKFVPRRFTDALHFRFPTCLRGSFTRFRGVNRRCESHRLSMTISLENSVPRAILSLNLAIPVCTWRPLVRTDLYAIGQPQIGKNSLLDKRLMIIFYFARAERPSSVFFPSAYRYRPIKESDI